MARLFISSLWCIGHCLILLNATANSKPHPSFVEQRSLLPLKLDVPVFSLATINEDGTTNMNIITYATQVGIKPKPVYAISLYKDTLSHENFIRSGKAALQLLPASAYNIVPLLGKQSGRDVNKMNLLKDLIQLCRIRLTNVMEEIVEFDEVFVIQDSPMILIAEYSGHDYPPLDVGDHQVFLCDIVRSISIANENTDDSTVSGRQSSSSSSSSSSSPPQEPPPPQPHLTTQVLRSMNII